MFTSVGAAAPVYALADKEDIPYSGAGMIFQVIIYLAIIIGLFLLIIKMLAKRNHIQPGRTIKLWGGAALGQNKAVQIVEIGRSLYVLGVGGEVRLLDKIEDPEEIEFIRNQSMSGHHYEMKGMPWIKKWFKQREKEEMEEQISFQQVFQQKMTHLTDRSKKVEQWIQDEQQAKRSENDNEK